ncbi:hypothetical protein PC128_g27759 [Phytophthora cactorum]|nr:hypothetical protein PC120_g28681 [Phytophthora cactorum]KAG3122474.1 hypothetical protein PC128_g27759 [Phytophthora cactorum]KAG4030247.1 hypothetical protein PC123_g29016 [Phytophthora cactorum]
MRARWMPCRPSHQELDQDRPAASVRVVIVRSVVPRALRGDKSGRVSQQDGFSDASLRDV